MHIVKTFLYSATFFVARGKYVEKILVKNFSKKFEFFDLRFIRVWGFVSQWLTTLKGGEVKSL